MLPIILVSKDKDKIEKFITDYKKTNNIPETNIFLHYPAKKEFSIDQIKEIKKSLAYETRDNNLHVLYDFSNASHEAQNAILKTLEEHASTVGFILQTTHKHALLPTLVSRSKVIVLDKKLSEPDRDIQNALAAFLKKGNLALMASDIATVTDHEAYQRFLKNTLLFFQERLAYDYSAGDVLREVMDVSRLVARNNLNPQHAVDHLLIFIKKKYTK